jgi:hypothetical protein
MTAKPTPGPWVARGSSIFRDSEEASSVASASAHRAEWRANARLIAAAPELLAALMDCVKRLHDAVGHIPDTYAAPYDEATRNAFAAIAKATGGEL